jgi:iron complex transport system substrate-binding protein
MKNNFSLTLVTLVTLFTFSSCRFGNKDNKEGQATRIVCISKQYTEYIYALGAEQDLAAVDISSDYPAEVKKLPTVGYHRALSLEGILAAKPSVIMCDGMRSLGPEQVVTQLQKLNIPIKIFDSKAKDIEGTKALIREMGAYFHKEKRADTLCNKLDSEMVIAMDSAKKYANQPKVKVLVIHFGQASNIYMVMSKGRGEGGGAGNMIEWAGGEMAVGDTTSMRQLSAEVVTKSNPDVILLTDFGYDRLGPDKIKELPGVALTNAYKNNKIFRIDAHDFLYLGPRTGENIIKLQKLLHQDGKSPQ